MVEQARVLFTEAIRVNIMAGIYASTELWVSRLNGKCSIQHGPISWRYMGLKEIHCKRRVVMNRGRRVCTATIGSACIRIVAHDTPGSDEAWSWSKTREIATISTAPQVTSTGHKHSWAQLDGTLSIRPLQLLRTML